MFSFCLGTFSSQYVTFQLHTFFLLSPSFLHPLGLLLPPRPHLYLSDLEVTCLPFFLTLISSWPRTSLCAAQPQLKKGKPCHSISFPPPTLGPPPQSFRLSTAASPLPSHYYPLPFMSSPFTSLRPILAPPIPPKPGL